VRHRAFLRRAIAVPQARLAVLQALLTPSIHTAWTSLESSSGSPSQITTSPRRPGRNEPISPSSPITAAGAELIAAKA
jgi:hypothetical protein